MLTMTTRRNRKPVKPPNRTGKPLQTWIPAELHYALDEYLRTARPKPNKSQVVRVALEDFLEKVGLWPPANPSADV